MSFVGREHGCIMFQEVWPVMEIKGKTMTYEKKSPVLYFFHGMGVYFRVLVKFCAPSFFRSFGTDS